jgi:hypothetical protein
LNAPKMWVTINKMGTRGVCLQRAKVDQATLQQSWTGYSCKYNPQFSVAPWTVGFAFWPDCDKNRKQAWFSSSHPHRHSSYTQANTGSPATIGKRITSFNTTKLCYGILPAVTIVLGGESDSYGATGTHTGKVCLPY